MDVSAIQAKLDALNSSPKKGGTNNDRKKFKWVPAIGKHEVRIIPLNENPDVPFQEKHFHYGYGKRTIYSPINEGLKDPILDFSKQLRKSKDPEDWKLAKKLEPKMRIFALVVVKGEEDKGVRYWEFGKNVYKELLMYGADEEVGDYTDVTEGRNMKIECVQGPQYKETSVRPAMKITPLSKDPEFIEKCLKDQPTVESMYKEYSYDEIKGFLQEWLNPEEDNEGEESGDPISGKVEDTGSIIDGPATDFNEENTTPIAKKSSGRQVVTDNEFDDLFEDDKE